MKISIVIPIYNEQENVDPLTRSIHAALAGLPHEWELILVNDGSSDATQQRLLEVSAAFGDHVRILELQRNFGQTAAMQAGIDAARGDILVTLDGDQQNDPADIPAMIAQMIADDLDLLAGWRMNRKDNFWYRKLPSILANRLIGRLSGIRMKDYGCSLKVYRMEVIREIRFYGEMHRFIPAWVAIHTSPSRIKQVPVNHHARRFGQSKYGLSRVYRVLLDLVSVYFFMRFQTRPAHFFGRIGIVLGAIGSVMLTYLLYVKIILGEDIGNRPLLITGIFLLLMSIQFFATGLLGEIMIRIYYESSGRRPYTIRRHSSKHLENGGWMEPGSVEGVGGA